MSVQTMVQVRVDGHVKEEATQVLSEMGLSVGDAVRLFLDRVATDKTFPFDVKIPNPVTIDAMNEAMNDGGKSFINVAELMADLNAEN